MFGLVWVGWCVGNGSDADAVMLVGSAKLWQMQLLISGKSEHQKSILMVGFF